MEISQSGIYPRRIQISWDLSGTNSELYIEIPLFCPRCESDRIWKTGKDPTRKTKPQKVYCADCGKRFYPHTSKFFQDQTQDFLMDLIDAALGRGQKVTDLATRYNISPSVISTILTDFLDYMAEVKEKARSFHEIYPGKVIVMDEKFLKIGGKKYKLIIAVNEHGDPLAYLLARDRAATTILGVLLEGIQAGGHPDLIVTDGFSGYRKAIKLAGLSIIHIEHIHKPPYGRVIITKIEQTKMEIKETSIGTTNDIFVQNGVNIGRVLVKTTKKNQQKKTWAP
ncbi:DDE-type integrase/transposase/recombinase [Patescibacteria group bacterium]|nr:DDE-type integrase/transposase/recombinase [Patescibacteria group bacterium]